MQVKKFEFNSLGENTYLIYDETGEAAIIDCGVLFENEQEKIKNEIRDNHLTLRVLLNTHLHLDHAFGNEFIYDTYGIKPQYDIDEERLMPSLNEQARAFGMPLEFKEIPVEKYLKEGDIITFGNIKLQAISIPGHSPASLCFYDQEHAYLFSGDVLFRQGIGRSDLWGGSHKVLISGIKNKLLTLPEDTVVYPGHGPATTIGYEKNNNPFL